MKASVLILLVLLALGAVLPAAAQASDTSGTPARHGLLLLGADESEGAGEEDEATEEPEAAEEGSEAEEAEGAEEGEGEEGNSAEDSHTAADRHRHSDRKRASVRLSRLALTRSDLSALRRSRPQASSVCFDFTLTAAATVEVTLSTASSSAGHAGWRTVSRYTMPAKRGSNLAHLHGRGALAAGHDRLTVTPDRGATQTLAFRVG